MEKVYLDVSELPVPEPFERIMQALEVLTNEQYLIVTHRREPLLLYKPLATSGFDFHVQKGNEHPFEILIWHKEQNAPQELIHPSIADISNTIDSCS
ncbi:MAG: DUF2249 domain-containing protein [Gammaproteobacteria bacterium]|nr:DUF2249 domain-containing protein [Gammaproteobacteria bacterium]